MYIDAEPLNLCQQTVFLYQMDHPVVIRVNSLEESPQLCALAKCPTLYSVVHLVEDNHLLTLKYDLRYSIISVY